MRASEKTLYVDATQRLGGDGPMISGVTLFPIYLAMTFETFHAWAQAIARMNLAERKRRREEKIAAAVAQQGGHRYTCEVCKNEFVSLRSQAEAEAEFERRRPIIEEFVPPSPTRRTVTACADCDQKLSAYYGMPTP